MSVTDRFWSKVQKSEECWEWRGTVSPQGYGYFCICSQGIPKNYRAHRLAWEFVYGAPPEDMYVCHTCDNRRCVRPDHLWLGTHSDNMLDCSDKGRYGRKKGERVYKKLSLEIAREIRTRYTGARGERAMLAREYHINSSTLGKILSGISYPESGVHKEQKQLSQDEADEIRSRYTGARGEKLALAREYGCSMQSIRHALMGKIWPDPDHHHIISPRDKLTARQVQEIRSRYTGEWGQQKVLAAEYGVQRSTIGQIISGSRWQTIPQAQTTRCRHKLTQEDARAIRARYTGAFGEQTALAKEYGVTKGAIRHIVIGMTHPDLV